MNNIEMDFWERCWQDEDQDDLMKFLSKYEGFHDDVIDIFKSYKITKICDAACGFGAYSLAFASNGFEISGFDISSTAINITQKGLRSYGFNSENYKVASILDTGYPDEVFDGVIAHAVIDHLTVADAQNAIKELLRITVIGGLVYVSFDAAEPGDFTCSHEMIEPGTMLYTDETRNGLIFHPYGWDEIFDLIGSRDIIYQNINNKNEKVIIIKK